MLPGTTTGIHDICGASSTFKGLQRWLPLLFSSLLPHLPLLCQVTQQLLWVPRKTPLLTSVCSGRKMSEIPGA